MIVRRTPHRAILATGQPPLRDAADSSNTRRPEAIAGRFASSGSGDHDRSIHPDSAPARDPMNPSIERRWWALVSGHWAGWPARVVTQQAERDESARVDEGNPREVDFDRATHLVDVSERSIQICATGRVDLATRQPPMRRLDDFDRTPARFHEPATDTPTAKSTIARVHPFE